MPSVYATVMIAPVAAINESRLRTQRACVNALWENLNIIEDFSRDDHKITKDDGQVIFRAVMRAQAIMRRYEELNKKRRA